MKRNYSLDVIKLLLAYVIVLFHFDKWVAPGPTVTVQIFFMISGFFLARKFYNRSYGDGETRYGPWHYTLDHAKALYPHYVLALVLFLGYSLVRSLVYFVAAPSGQGLQDMLTMIYDQLPDLVFLQSAFQYDANLNAPTWQLSALMIAGYFVYALLCHNEKLSRTLIFPAGILMIQCLLHTGVDLFSRYGCFYMPLLRAFSPMCLGVLTYRFSTTDMYRRFRQNKGLFHGLGLLALPAMMIFEDRNDLHLLWTAVLILNCMEPESIVNRLLNRKCFAGCGKLSYILYLNHAMFARFYINILIKLLQKTGIGMPEWLYTPVYLVLLTAFCLVLQWLTERLQNRCRKKAAGNV